MSAIFGPEPTQPCDRNCGEQRARRHIASGRYVCALCLKLGDRSAQWFLHRHRAATSEEERQELRDRFAAAKGRSWTVSDVERHIAEGKPLPPGIYQWALEQAEGRAPLP